MIGLPLTRQLRRAACAARRRRRLQDLLCHGLADRQTNLLQSSLTRAIFFSALTTATAFGSLWLSSHPGTAAWVKLLALSLVTTLAAVLFSSRR